MISAFLYFYAKTSRIQRILDVFIEFDVIFAYHSQDFSLFFNVYTYS